MKSSWILLLAVWLGFVPMDLGNKPLCYPSRNCYTVLTGLPFFNATTSCGPKGSLTTMRNEQEKKETLQFATQIQSERNISEFWIGLYLPMKNCIKKDGNLYGFMWISEEETSNVSIWDTSPKKSCTTNKRCVVLQRGSTASGRGDLTWSWKSAKCGRRFPPICRILTSFSPSEDVDHHVDQDVDHETLCDQGECTINTSTTAISASPVIYAATSSPLNDDENLFEKLVLPLILGLVALGILIMLVWGGVQMCVRRRKPKRKKSIVPVVEPEAGSDTDSTDNSSSDEEGDSQDMAEMA